MTKNYSKMGSYKRNLIIVILIVFYSLMNLNNANCPSDQEKNLCLDNMKKYCGENLQSHINCAKVAITNTHIGKTLDQRRTPNYVFQYFANHVSPFVPAVVPVDIFCKSTELFEEEGIKSFLIFLNRSRLPAFSTQAEKEMHNKQTITNHCKTRIAFLEGLTIQDIFIKENINNYMGNTFAYIYLRVFAKYIEMRDNVPEGVRKSPEEFCQAYEHMPNN